MSKKWKMFEAAKQELARRNLSPAEYDREIRKLCQKYKV